MNPSFIKIVVIIVIFLFAGFIEIIRKELNIRGVIPAMIVVFGALFAMRMVWRSFPSKEQQRIKEEKLRAKSEGVYTCEGCGYTVFKKDFLQDSLLCPKCGERLSED